MRRVSLMTALLVVSGFANGCGESLKTGLGPLNRPSGATSLSDMGCSTLPTLKTLPSSQAPTFLVVNNPTRQDCRLFAIDAKGDEKSAGPIGANMSLTVQAPPGQIYLITPFKDSRLVRCKEGQTQDCQRCLHVIRKGVTTNYFDIVNR